GSRSTSFIFCTRSSVRRCCSPLTVSGGLRFRMGLAPLRSSVPWYTAGRKPEPQHGAPPSGVPSGWIITQYAGRLSLAVPRPYVTHEPRLGKPISVRPLCSSYIAGACTVLVHQHDFKNA